MSFIKNSLYSRMIGVTALCTTLMLSSLSASLAAKTIRLDAGTVIPVRLNDTISSNESRKGDSFTATLKTDDYSDNYGLPAGTKIEGIVDSARAKNDKDPGMLEVSFQRVRLPDGHSYTIDGSLIGLDNKSVDRKSDGRLVAKPSHRNDRLTWVGYGAGAGLIVGLLTKHSLEDTLLGGLLGYGAGALQKGHSDARDVVLKPGTELGVRLDHTATLTTYGSDHSSKYYRNREDGNRVSTERRDYGQDRTDYGTSDRREHSNVGVMVDDSDVRFESTARPFINENGVVLVPASPVLKAARVPYTYHSGTHTLKATGTENPVRVTMGSSIAVVNGTDRVRMDTPAQLVNGVVYVPMKFLSLATGYDVKYDSGSRTVILSSR
jgi:hypothetical protein